jgi:hypothetical protein
VTASYACWPGRPVASLHGSGRDRVGDKEITIARRVPSPAALWLPFPGPQLADAMNLTVVGSYGS